MLVNNSCMRSCVILKNNPFSGVYESQWNGFSHHTKVQIFSRDSWNNHERARTLIRNCSPAHNSRSRSSVPRPQVGYKCSASLVFNKHTAITGTKTESAFIGNQNRSPPRPPISYSLILLTKWFGVSELQAAGNLAGSSPWSNRFVTNPSVTVVPYEEQHLIRSSWGGVANNWPDVLALHLMGRWCLL